MVKANLYQSLGQLATVMDDAHLDFLFQRFESARSRPLPDTLRLFGLLQQLVLSDSRVGGLGPGRLACAAVDASDCCACNPANLSDARSHAGAHQPSIDIAQSCL